MADDDATASTGSTASIEEKTNGWENAISVSKKEPFDNRGWLSATYHNSRLIAVPAAGTEAVDKSVSSQPEHKENLLRKEKLPSLPKNDFKVIIKLRDGLNISQLSKHQAWTKGRRVPDTRRCCLLKLYRASNREWTHLGDPVHAMQRGASYAGKEVQGMLQETEKPTTKNKRADGHRGTRRRWTRPGLETLVQQGWQLTIQVPISIKTTLMIEIGVQDPPGSR
ncbi:hypothetical protein HPB51_000370 [Rhipicephalus microplus]|uniref:Uncharacterized protein n=1 Tax=Rhipicephalus microplus TaxID=6941 RepID=A0A9J6EPJ6_RHIMP|nr:hypothetical protein HPB51_000370 [Rhipicephalus microplus]